MRGESMKDKSKKSTYSTTFGVDPSFSHCTMFDIERKKPQSLYLRGIADLKKVGREGIEPPTKRL